MIVSVIISGGTEQSRPCTPYGIPGTCPMERDIAGRNRHNKTNLKELRIEN
jgi:hypothetical protein